MKDKFMKIYNEYKKLVWSIGYEEIDMEDDGVDGRKLYMCMLIYDFIKQTDETEFIGITNDMIDFLQTQKETLTKRIQNGEFDNI